MGYLQYLDVLLASQSVTVHSELPKECRLTRDYELCVLIRSCSAIVGKLIFCIRYIKALHSYLLSFTKRAQPLVDVDTQQKEAEAQFSAQWEANEIEGWEEPQPKAASNGEGNGEGIWCAACKSHPLQRNHIISPGVQVKSCIQNKPYMTHISRPRSTSKQRLSRQSPASHP